MNIEIKQVARATGNWNLADVTERYFGNSPEAEKFIKSLSLNWSRVPAGLMGETTEANFLTYARLPRYKW